MKNFGKLSSILSALALASALPAFADSLTIDATFDSSITADPGAVAAINAAISSIEADITSPNNITVSLYFNSMSTGLGESNTGFVGLSYDDYYNAFAAVATQPNQVTALNSLGPAPTSESSGNPVTGSPQVDVTTAEARNLGFSGDSGFITVGTGTYDSEISLNTSITFPPQPNDGSNYGLQAVANHEIDEALGIGGAGSTIGGTGFFSNPGDLDLFRYSAPGVRTYSALQTTDPFSYLSIDGGNTVITYFNQTTGADYGDWLSNPIPVGFGPQVQDAFGEPGTNPALGTSEITAFNAIGYDLVAPTTPEPGTIALLGGGLLFAFSLRRRRA